jgi:ABC-type multidrug transport system ATPase subunit
MGASGAGKTTLLNVLTFRNRSKLEISGDISINGKLLKDPAQLAAISGYVQQDDLFIGTLKVKEHLKFQVIIKYIRILLVYFDNFIIL